MSKELGPRERKLREQREERFAKRNRPNPFEDAARGRDPAPKSSDGSRESRPAYHEVPKLAAPPDDRSRDDQGAVLKKANEKRHINASKLEVASNPSDTKSKRPSHKIIEGLKEAIAVASGAANPAKVTTVKVGRPKKGEKRDKPWEAEGISKASYYRRRQARAAKEET